MVSEATKQRSCTQDRIQALSGVDSGNADKRPGGCRKGFWGKCGRMSAPRPNRRIAKSTAVCQLRTRAPQQNHLIGAREKCRRRG